MIGDLILAASLQFPKQGSDFDINIIARSLGVTGKNAIKDTKQLTTSDYTFPLGGIGTIGYVALRNDGAFLIDTPAAPIISNVGTPGAATWTYKIVARKGTAYTVAGAAGSTATGNATLTTGNYNHIKWLPVDDAESYDIYRTVSGGTPASLGKIGNVLPAAFETDPVTGIKYIFLDDKALVGDASSAPSSSPFDFSCIFGPDGTNYQIKLRGQDFAVFPWNAAALHGKANFNTTPIFAAIFEA